MYERLYMQDHLTRPFKVSRQNKRLNVIPDIIQINSKKHILSGEEYNSSLYAYFQHCSTQRTTTQPNTKSGSKITSINTRI